MSLLQFCEWAYASPVGVMVRESLWGFQILVAFHILGLMFSAGTIVWLDLRLLGVSMQRCRASEMYRRLMPWSLAGFMVMFVTGGILFAGFATTAYGNLYFRIKLAAMLLAGLNAAMYHLVTEREIARWDAAARPSFGARCTGAASILLWTAVILCGRMMSYTMF